jgi:hypothetical protein
LISIIEIVNWIEIGLYDSIYLASILKFSALIFRLCKSLV